MKQKCHHCGLVRICFAIPSTELLICRNCLSAHYTGNTREPSEKYLSKAPSRVEREIKDWIMFMEQGWSPNVSARKVGWRPYEYHYRRSTNPEIEKIAREYNQKRRQGTIHRSSMVASAAGRS